MARSQEFHPDWTSAPGETIADVLAERGLTFEQFAQRIGHTPEEATKLLQGRATITIALARKLEQVLGASVAFWMARDFQYRRDVAGLPAAEKDWLAELPMGDMIKFGWLKPAPRPSDEVSACLRFFDVPSVEVWHEACRDLQKMVAFRTSPSFDSNPAAVAAWLRQGEIEGEAIACNTWDPVRFEQSLSGLRALTRQKDPSRFVLELQKRCAEAGVAVAVVRAPNGCRASGATRFLTKHKALLLLSFRHLSDDQFWFSFFHEAGHLLLHGAKRFFLEGIESPTSKEEEEANEFAGRTLVPREFQETMLELPAYSREVIRFARRVGVSPGIIVGQLQHFKRINPDELNGLKRRFRWT